MERSRKLLSRIAELLQASETTKCLIEWILILILVGSMIGHALEDPAQHRPWLQPPYEILVMDIATKPIAIG